MSSIFRAVSKLRLVARLVVITIASLTVFTNFSLADDCKRVPNILVLFDASGYMREKDHYQALLKQMGFFEKAIPLTADGFFNIGLRHYGLKVGMGCENTESILAIQPWDPERFINSFPRSVSYGTSSLGAGLRAAGDEIAPIPGKTMIVIVGGGIESCKTDPIKIAEQICSNNPDLEIHTFQIGNSQDGAFYLRGIAQKGRGTYHSSAEMTSAAAWHSWMKQYWVQPCRPSAAAPPVAGSVPATRSPVTFDFNSFSVRSSDPVADAANLGAIEAAVAMMRQNPSVRLNLHGFADGRGKPEYNLGISKKRAEAVARHLSKVYGIPISRMRIVPHGSSGGYAAPAEDRMGRRVEFEFVQ
ncbi:MAG: OmpA family protein [Syntrophaceae bacterium]|nr:OmpA family protein [Syntrophaceae bacterium]